MPRLALERLFADPRLLAAHRAMLPHRLRRASAARSMSRCVVGLAKLEDCTTLAEAAAMLTRAEMMAVLSDPRGLDRLAALERAQPSLKNVK